MPGHERYVQERNTGLRPYRGVPGAEYDPYALLPPTPSMPASSLAELFVGQEERKKERPEREEDRGILGRMMDVLTRQAGPGQSVRELEERYLAGLSPRDRLLRQQDQAGPGEGAARAGRDLYASPEAHSLGDFFAKQIVATGAAAGERLAEASPRAGQFFSSVFPRFYEGTGAMLAAGPKSTRPAGRAIRETFRPIAERMEAPAEDLHHFERAVISGLGSSVPMLAAAGVGVPGKLHAMFRAGVTMLPLSANSMHQHLTEAGLNEDEVAVGIRIGAPIISALESLVPADVATRIIPGASRILSGSMTRYVIRGFLQEGVQEWGTEFIQTPVPLIVELALSEDPTLDRETVMATLKEAFYNANVGFVAGGIMGAGGSTVGQFQAGSRDEAEQQVADYLEGRRELDSMTLPTVDEAPFTSEAELGEVRFDYEKGDERAGVTRNSRAGQPIEGTDQVEGPFRVTYWRIGEDGKPTGFTHQPYETANEARAAALKAGFTEIVAEAEEAPEPPVTPEEEVAPPEVGPEPVVEPEEDVAPVSEEGAEPPQVDYRDVLPIHSKLDRGEAITEEEQALVDAQTRRDQWVTALPSERAATLDEQEWQSWLGIRSSTITGRSRDFEELREVLIAIRERDGQAAVDEHLSRIAFDIDPGNAAAIDQSVALREEFGQPKAEEDAAPVPPEQPKELTDAQFRGVRNPDMASAVTRKKLVEKGYLEVDDSSQGWKYTQKGADIKNQFMRSSAQAPQERDEHFRKRQAGWFELQLADTGRQRMQRGAGDIPPGVTGAAWEVVYDKYLAQAKELLGFDESLDKHEGDNWAKNRNAVRSALTAAAVELETGEVQTFKEPEAAEEVEPEPEPEVEPEPEPEAEVEVEPEPEPDLGPVPLYATGAETKVKLSDGTEIPAKYAIVHQDDAPTSHDPDTFAPLPGPLAEYQDRKYDREPASQEKVEAMAQDYDADRVLTLGLDPFEGPPVVGFYDRLRYSGSARGMGLARAKTRYPKKYAAYIEQLSARAEQFGFRRDAVDDAIKFAEQHDKVPELVRVLDKEIAPGDRAELVSKMNDPGTASRDPLQDAATKARRIVEFGLLEELTGSMSEDETIKSYLASGRSRAFTKQLLERGVITTQEKADFLDGKTGLLNESGRDLLEKAMLTLALGDVAVVERAPAQFTLRISKGLPAIVATKQAGWNITAVLKSAANLSARAATDNLTLEELLATEDVFSGRESDVAYHVAKFIRDHGVNDVTQALRGIAQDALGDTNEDMFGGRPGTLEESVQSHLTEEGIDLDWDIDLTLGKPLGDPRKALQSIARNEDVERPPIDLLNLTMPAEQEIQEGPVALEMGDTGKPVSAPSVIKALAKVVASVGGRTPIRVGRMGQYARTALGFFKVHGEVIRIREANDITTATHEVGHALEKHVYGWPKGTPWKGPRVTGEMQQELAQMGHNLYGDTKPAAGYKREGFAEFIDFYVTDPARAEREAPKFHKWFDTQFRERNPEAVKALEQARDLAVRYFGQGSVKRALAGIAPMTTRGEKFRSGLRDAPSTLFEMFVESAQPLYVAAREAEKRLGRPLTMPEDPFALTTALRLVHAVRAKFMVEQGMINLNGQRTGGAALEDVIPLIKKAKVPSEYAGVASKGDLFMIYLWARRAQALWSDPQGARNPGLTKADADQVIQEIGSREFELAAGIVYDWNAGVLDYAAEASPTFARVVALVKDRDPGNYIPLQREFEELSRRYKETSASTSSPVKRLTGSGRRIRDPFTVMVQQAEETIRASHQRIVIDAMVKLSRVEGMEHLMELIPVGREPVAHKTVEALLNEIKAKADALGDFGTSQAINDLWESAEDGLLGEMVTFFAPKAFPTKAKPDELLVPVWNGELQKVQWYQVSQGIYNALGGMDSARLPAILDLTLGMTARTFRAGTTSARASFGLIWNPMKDLPTAGVNSRANSVNMPMLIAQGLGGIAEAVVAKTTGGRITSEWVDFAISLGVEMALPMGEDIPHTRRAIKRLKGGGREITFDPRYWWDAYRDLIQGPELGVRIAEGKRVAKDIGWEIGTPITFDQSLQILTAMKQVSTDFTAAGTIGRVINKMVPFHTASIQGVRATVRAMRRNPRVVAARMLQLSLLSLLLWWEHKDEEWYQEKSYKDRYRYWYFPVTIGGNETLLRIPRPFDIGAVTSVFQAAAEAWYEDDPEAITEWMDNVRESTQPPILPVPVDIIAEQLANKEFYFDRPIVPMGEKRGPREEQYNEYTDLVSVKLGEWFNLSPRRLEHVREGVLGRVSTDILDVLGLGGPTPRPEAAAEPADWPVVGRVFQRGGRISSGSKSVNELYDVLEKMQRKAASKKQEESQLERQLRLQLNDAARAVSALSYIRSHVPDADKRSRIGRLRARIARQALDAYEELDIDRKRFRDQRTTLEDAEEALKVEQAQ